MTMRLLRNRSTLAWAAVAVSLAFAVSCGDTDTDLGSFFPTNPDLAASPLGTRHFNSSPENAFRLRIDQGIRTVADASDIYIDRAKLAPITGLDERVLASLEERAADLSRDERKAWERYGKLFATGDAPIAEGILDESTAALKIPVLAENDPDTRMLEGLLSDLTNLVETRGALTVDRVHTRRGSWIQDYFVPFRDGVLGIPPHLDFAAYHAAVRAVQGRARGFTIGGTAFTMKRPIEDALRGLAESGSRFQPLRTFVEGGNIVFAAGRDGAVRAIVGRNTVLLTAEVYKLDEGDTLQLIADDFHLPREHVIAIPQPDYHIDLYIRPGAAGEVFVANQVKGEQMLERVLLDRQTASGDRDALEALRIRARRIHASAVGQKLQTTLEEIRRRLQQAGFEVTDYPSLYYSYVQAGEYIRSDGEWQLAEDARSYIHINTLNNRYVTAADGRVLNFTLATGYDALDRQFEAFEQQHGSDEVYFLGRRLAAPKFWGNQVLIAAAGLGCLTNL